MLRERLLFDLNNSVNEKVKAGVKKIEEHYRALKLTVDELQFEKIDLTHRVNNLEYQLNAIKN